MSNVKLTVLDNSNIVESYPNITLPLTYSFIKIAYTGVFKGIIGSNLKNDKIMAKYENVFDNMIKSYNGRIYYCINNWYSLINFMPFSKKYIPIWQDMMGVKNTEIHIDKYHKFTFGQKAKMSFNMLKSAFSVPCDMKLLEGYFARIQEYFDKTYDENLAIPELISLFHEIKTRVLDKWYITLSNDMYAFVWTGLLKKKLAKKSIDVTEYISGITGLESLKPVKALLNLAQKYGEEPHLLDFPEVQEYIKIYGDRSPQELKLECMTYREYPELLERQIRVYAEDKNKLAEMIKNLETHKEIKQDYYTKHAQLGIENREISRLNRSRIYGMVRRIFIDIGKKLFGNDWFDIFYLTIDEVFEGVFDKALIEKRKSEYAEYEKLPAHSRLVLRGDCVIDEIIAKNWTGSFVGAGTSQGVFEGEAVVLDKPSGNIDVKNKIIVTKTTDPGWVFLLCQASGIVAEKGSVLSHTAIVSRELKIPAVVGVENATAIIKTGDIIRINGYDGKVEIVKAD